MSSEPSLLTIDTTALQETVGQVCAGHDRLERFLHDLFGDMEALADEVTRQARLIDSARQDQDTRRSDRDEQLGVEREQLEATFQRIEELTEKLGSVATGDGVGSAQLQDVISGIEAERASVQAAVEATQSQGSELARMADEMAAARQDLAAAREELRAQHDLLSQAPARSPATSDPELSERIDRLEQERISWTQERAVLETELDTVRSRAAELADALEEERQRVAGERNTWSEELRQMRRLLESLNDRPVPAQEPGAGSAPPVEDPAPEEDAQDPVLDSVMAQFEILQKDLARRRKAKPAAK